MLSYISHKILPENGGVTYTWVIQRLLVELYIFNSHIVSYYAI